MLIFHYKSMVISTCTCNQIIEAIAMKIAVFIETSTKSLPVKLKFYWSPSFWGDVFFFFIFSHSVATANSQIVQLA